MSKPTTTITETELRAAIAQAGLEPAVTQNQRGAPDTFTCSQATVPSATALYRSNAGQRTVPSINYAKTAERRSKSVSAKELCGLWVPVLRLPAMRCYNQNKAKKKRGSMDSKNIFNWLMPGANATTEKHGSHNQASHGRHRGGGSETKYDFRKGQKVRNPYGKRETVMSADDARVVTYESARRNEWYHPSKVYLDE